MLSRIFGFIRDMVIARFFGASIYSDAFFVAFKIPNLFRRFFAEGAFSQAFIPVLSEYKENEGFVNEPNTLIEKIFSLMTIVLCAFVALGIIFASVLVYIFAPGFAENDIKYEITVELLRLTFPYLAFISLTSLLGSVLNIYGKFAIPAFTPALLNLSIIISAIFLSPNLNNPIFALGFGVSIGGVLQLALQYYAFRSLGLRISFGLDFEHSGIKKVFKLMVPVIFGASVAQINLLIDTVIASFLVSGSVSWLYFADRIIEFPLGAFGAALSVAILPTLSKQANLSQLGPFKQTLAWALRWVWLIALPASVGIFLLASPILITLFAYGEFGFEDVSRTSDALVAYSLGLPAFILIKVFASGYFSRQDTKTPVKIAVVALVVNVILNLALVGSLSHVGLALATSISAWLNAGLLWWGLKKADLMMNKKHRFYYLKIIAATVIMAICLKLVEKFDLSWHRMEILERIGSLFFIIFLAAFIYAAVLIVLGLRPRHFVSSNL